MTSGISLPLGDLQVFGGLSITQGFATIQGLDTEHSRSYIEACQNQEDRHIVVCDEENNLAESLILRGVLFSGGPTFGVIYNFLPIGNNLKLGATTTLGIQSDTSRAYYWGQVGLTVTPSRSVKK